MSAPFKTGLEYFPHDVDMSIDPRMEYIEAIHGIIGYAVYNKILEKIYHDGYYTKWEDRDLVIFAKKINVDKNVVINVVNDCINEGLFHKKIYDKYRILTSAGIQKRYMRCCEKCRRKRVILIKEFLLLELTTINSLINEDNYIINSINDGINPQIEREREREKERNTLAQILAQKFDQFWKTYPKKKSKGKARKAFYRINPGEPLLAKMLATIEKAKTSEDWMKEGGQYIPYPEKWLHAEGWEDEIMSAKDIQQAKNDGIYQEYLAAKQTAMDKFKSSLDIDDLRAKFRADWLGNDPNFTKDNPDWEEHMEPHFQHKLAGYIEDNLNFPSFKSWKKEPRYHEMVC